MARKPRFVVTEAEANPSPEATPETPPQPEPGVAAASLSETIPETPAAETVESTADELKAAFQSESELTAADSPAAPEEAVSEAEGVAVDSLSEDAAAEALRADAGPSQSADAGGYSPDIAGFLLSSVQEKTEGGEDGEGRKTREKKDKPGKISQEDRAKFAVMFGGGLEKALDVGASFFGANLTVKEFSQEMTADFLKKIRETGIELPEGVPFDLISEEDYEGLPVAQEFTIVLKFSKGRFRPTRFEAGRRPLRDGERMFVDGQRPEEGDHHLIIMPANIAHAIMYNIASGPSKMADKLMIWLEAHENGIRITYASAMLLLFIISAFFRTRKKS